MSRTACFLLALVLGLAGALGGYFYGHGQGATAEAAKRDGQAVKDLTGLIDSHKSLVKQANAASSDMRRATALRAVQDATTTKEFKDALNATADSRAGCVFPDDVMRQLSAARDRAAEASAFGVRGSVPRAGPGTKQ